MTQSGKRGGKRDSTVEFVFPEGSDPIPRTVFNRFLTQNDVDLLLVRHLVLLFIEAHEPSSIFNLTKLACSKFLYPKLQKESSHATQQGVVYRGREAEFRTKCGKYSCFTPP